MSLQTLEARKEICPQMENIVYSYTSEPLTLSFGILLFFINIDQLAICGA